MLGAPLTSSRSSVMPPSRLLHKRAGVDFSLKGDTFGHRIECDTLVPIGAVLHELESLTVDRCHLTTRLDVLREALELGQTYKGADF